MSKQMESDLDWLARNVHKWPAGHQGWCYVVTRLGGDKAAASNNLLNKSATEITIDAWLARRAELQGKPSWDSHNWPQIFQNENGHWFGARDGWDFYVNIGRGWKGDGVSLLRDDGEWLSHGAILGDWKDTLERRPDMHKSPDKIDTSAERVQKSAESIHVEPNSKPVRATNGTVLLEQPGVVAGTGAAMSIGKWAAEHSGRSPSDQIREAVINEALRLLRENPDHLASEELAELRDLCDAELTKRDAAVCGGQKYLDAHWHERGELPPVGVKCEMFSVDDWEPVFIVGYSADGYMVVEMECEFITATQANKFRPIRPERNELLSIIQSGHFTDGDMADAILAAGFTKGGAV